MRRERVRARDMSMLDAIRAAAEQGPWSQGVRLARAGNVFSVGESGEEVLLKVVVARAPVPFTVHMWPEDEDWSCDCTSEADVCAHVAAAVIAWAKAARASRPSAKPRVRSCQPSSARRSTCSCT